MYEVVTIAVLSNIANITNAIVQTCKKSLLHSTTFKDKQLDALKSIFSENDLFVSLLTGYGKSLIYAALPLVFDKMKGTQ